MKRNILITFILCIILCGCENAVSSDEIKTDENDMISTTIVPFETESENMIDFTESAEINTKERESREEFIERINGVYLEIKEDTRTIDSEKTQILFNEVPWGSCLLDTNSKLKKEDIMELSNSLFPEPVSVYSMLGIKVALDDRFYDNKYYNNNVGGVARPSRKDKISVAGYEIDDCMLLFSAILKDDVYILSDECSSLYAAEYTIKPNNAEDAKKDLENKIISIYGEPDSIREIEPYENAEETNEFIYWYGSNDTILVLYVDGYNVVHLSYVWLGGEDLLNAALDYAEKQQKEDAESVYGNGNTDGL